MQGGYVNGTGTAARFNQPRGFCQVGSDIYVADSGNHCIRKIDSDGVVTTFAGASPSNGLSTSGHLDGAGTNARFWYPSDIKPFAFGSNQFLFVADTYNRVIRQINISTGMVTTIIGVPLSAGNVNGLAPRLGEIRSIAITEVLYLSGNYTFYIYALDTYYRVIRAFYMRYNNDNCIHLNAHTAIGLAESPAALTDGDQANARFITPRKIAMASSSATTYGSPANAQFNTWMYISDGSVLRLFVGNSTSTFSSGRVDTIITGALDFTGKFPTARLANPEGISSYGNGNWYSNRQVLMCDSQTGVLLDASTLTCLAGKPGELGATDGVGVSRLYRPTDVIANINQENNGYVLDNNSIRKYQSDNKIDQSVSFSIENPSNIISGDTRILSATPTSRNPVTFASSDVLVADISGTTLTAIKSGTAVIYANTETDRDYNAASSQVEITITNPTPVISNLTASGEVGAPFSYQITATQNPLSYSTGSLPEGLYSTPDGKITGTPTTAGVTSVPISVTSELGANATATLVITITGASGRITSPLVSTASVGLAYSYQITANGSPTSFNATGLPSGLSVNTSTGLISGIPLSAVTADVTLSASQGSVTETAILTLRVIDISIPLDFTLTQNKAAADGGLSPWVTATKEGSLITVIVNRAPSVGTELGDVHCAKIDLSTPGSGRSLPWEASIDLIKYVPPPTLTVSPAGPVVLAYNATSTVLSATIRNASAASLSAVINGISGIFEGQQRNKTFPPSTSFTIPISVISTGDFDVDISVPSLGLSQKVYFSIVSREITLNFSEVSAEYSSTSSPRVACSSSGNNSPSNCLAIIKYGDVAKMQLTSSSNLFMGTEPKVTLAKNSDVGTGGNITLGALQNTSSGQQKAIFDVTGVYPGSIGLVATRPAEQRFGVGHATATVQVNKATLGAGLTEANGFTTGAIAGIWMDQVFQGSTDGSMCTFYNRFLTTNTGFYQLNLTHKRCGSDIILPHTIPCVVFMTYSNASTSGDILGYITNTIHTDSSGKLPNFSWYANMLNDSMGALIEFPTAPNTSYSRYPIVNVFFNKFRGYDGDAFSIHYTGGRATGCTSSAQIDPPVPYYFRGDSIAEGGFSGHDNAGGFRDIFEGHIVTRFPQGTSQVYETRFVETQRPESATISLYVLPDMPYQGATLGDYFDFSTSQLRNLAYGTDFSGISSLGVDYFPAGQDRPFRRIAQISISGSTISNDS